MFSEVVGEGWEKDVEGKSFWDSGFVGIGSEGRYFSSVF